MQDFEPHKPGDSPESEQTPELSVVVASYNAAPLLAQCLQSLPAGYGELPTEVIVVDNCSVDGSPEMVTERFPWVRLLKNDRNLGFARANNRALQTARGRYLLLLNPDTIVPKDTLGPIVEFLEKRPDVGIVGCRLERPDGVLDEACKRGFPTPWNAVSRFLMLDRFFPKSRLLGSYRQTWQDPAGCYEVDSVVGAFMLLRREIFEEIGGLDEDYFMFGEDLDWCFRVKRSRWKVFYLGDRRVIHHKGGSTRRHPQSMNFHFHRSMVLFHKKHLQHHYPFFINWLVLSGIGARYLLRSMWTFLPMGRRELASPLPSVSFTRAAGSENAACEDEAAI